MLRAALFPIAQQAYLCRCLSGGQWQSSASNIIQSLLGGGEESYRI